MPITNGSVYYPGLIFGTPFFKPVDYVSLGFVDLQTLNYVGEPDEDLICPICFSPFIDPITTACKHSFCLRCMMEVIHSIPPGRDVPCPMCRAVIDCTLPFDPTPLPLFSAVNFLLVECPHSSRGCTAQIPRAFIRDHCRRKCVYRSYTDMQGRQTQWQKWKLLITPVGEVRERRRVGRMV
jgi:ubiquitin conjugation factor E4 B